MLTGVERIAFTSHADARGALVAIENNRDLPYAIQRIYYIYGAAGDAVRGKHAHKDLKQTLVCVAGSCDILLDNGHEREIVRLDRPDVGIYIHGLIWREMMHFSPDCVLLALVDRPYDPQDYIHDYNEFRSLVEEEKP